MPNETILQPYTHDCDCCVWVGWVQCKDAENGWGNMYFCPPTNKFCDYHDPKTKKMAIRLSDRGLGQGSVIIRYGNEPFEYLSMPVGVCTKGSLGITR